MKVFDSSTKLNDVAIGISVSTIINATNQGPSFSEHMPPLFQVGLSSKSTKKVLSHKKSNNVKGNIIKVPASSSHMDISYIHTPADIDSCSNFEEMMDIYDSGKRKCVNIPLHDGENMDDDRRKKAKFDFN